ncbi:MAG: methionyl-tRNA formyltransferase, partial [[Eubacterium] siraeum]|nr:methionyl-tRNA formyltransferase [[Eubacterium] siraeum]
LAILGGEAIIEAVKLLESGKAVFVKQDENSATHCSMISKADGKIDFNRTAKELDCFVRGMSPWPSAYTKLNGKTLKIFEIEAIGDNAEKTAQKCGIVVAADAKNGLVVAVKDSALIRLKSIQLEGASRMSDVDFLRGRKIEVGTVLG